MTESDVRSSVLRWTWPLVVAVSTGAAAAAARGRLGVSGVFLSIATASAAGLLALPPLPFVQRHWVALHGWQRGLSIAAAVGAAMAILSPPACSKLFPKSSTVVLEVTGTKNPAARGNEVWIYALDVGNHPIALEKLEKQGPWEIRPPGVLISYREQPASIRWRGDPFQTVRVEVLSHPWSGIVRIRTNGSTQAFDLYEDGPGRRRTIELTIPPSKAISRASIAVLLWVLCLAGWIFPAVLSLRALRPINAPHRTTPWLETLVGVCVGMVVFFQHPGSGAQRYFAGAGAAVGICWILYWSLAVLRARFHLLSLRDRLLWGLGSFATVTYLLWAVPLPSFRPPQLYEVELEATGEKNPKAGGSEVWVFPPILGDGSELSLSEFDQVGQWELRQPPTLVSHQAQPARLRWSGRVQPPLLLQLQKHPWSGVLSYRVNREMQKVDLYREGPAVPYQIELGRSSSLVDRVVEVMTYLLYFFLASVMLLQVGLWLALSPGRVRAPSSVHWRQQLWYGLVPLVVWSVWLLAFFPGLMSADSTEQWLEAMGRQPLDDAHPIFLTLWFRVLQWIWLSPAAVGVTQILLFSILIVWFCTLLRQQGVSTAALWIIVILVAVSPINCTYVITLWKDIPFSLSILTATGLLLWASTDAAEILRRRSFWILFGAASAVTLLVRHNGSPAVLGGFVGLLLLVWRPWRVLGLAVLVFALVFVFYRVVDLVHPVQGLSASWLSIGVLRAHVGRGTPISSEQRKVLESVRNLSDGWNYNCLNLGSTVYTGNFNRKAVEQYKSELARVALDLSLRNPGAVIAHYVCSSSMLWKVCQERDLLYGPALAPNYDVKKATITQALGAPQPEFVLPRVAEALAKWVSKSLDPRYTWLFWRPALPFYLLLFSAAIACWRSRGFKPLLVLFPLFFHTASLVFLIPSPDTRYQYPAFLIAMFLTVPWIFFSREPLRTEETSP